MKTKKTLTIISYLDLLDVCLNDMRVTVDVVEIVQISFDLLKVTYRVVQRMLNVAQVNQTTF